MKIEQEIVELVLRNHLEDPEIIQRIVSEIQNVAEQNRPQREETAVHQDKRNVVVLVCAEEDVEAARNLAERCVGYCFQLVDAQDANLLVDHMLTSAAAYNVDKRAGSRVTNFGEACEHLSPKRHLESFPKKIFTKEGSQIVVTTNLPVPNQ